RFRTKIDSQNLRGFIERESRSATIRSKRAICGSNTSSGYRDKFERPSENAVIKYANVAKPQNTAKKKHKIMV
ncbi:12349_t:CDS:2, partial [Entrophospora sp. SA101]